MLNLTEVLCLTHKMFSILEEDISKRYFLNELSDTKIEGLLQNALKTAGSELGYDSKREVSYKDLGVSQAGRTKAVDNVIDGTPIELKQFHCAKVAPPTKYVYDINCDIKKIQDSGLSGWVISTLVCAEGLTNRAYGEFISLREFNDKLIASMDRNNRSQLVDPSEVQTVFVHGVAITFQLIKIGETI